MAQRSRDRGAAHAARAAAHGRDQTYEAHRQREARAALPRALGRGDDAKVLRGRVPRGSRERGRAAERPGNGDGTMNAGGAKCLRCKAVEYRCSDCRKIFCPRCEDRQFFSMSRMRKIQHEAERRRSGPDAKSSELMKYPLIRDVRQPVAAR